MSKKLILKRVWLLFCLILHIVPLFFFFSPDFINALGICMLIAAIISYPLTILFARLIIILLVWFDVTPFQPSIGYLYLLLFIFCIMGYLQWFVLTPRLIKFIKKTFFRKDLQITFSVTSPSVKMISDSKPDESVSDWRKNWYDEQKRTPVERVFEKDES